MPLASPIVEPAQVASTLSNRKTRNYLIVLAVVWLISSLYMATHVKRGWVPHDEGTLGLSAERVLQGQLPHRDFDDYTGGLTYLHALAFRVWGINSGSMRNVLLIFSVAWVPAVFYIASRFSSAVAAGVVTLVAVAWSVPNYPGPMPSWYTLFFATWGVAALLRYLEKSSNWWLFAAGLCGGFSMLAKVTGAYYIAAVLLFLVFREQCLSENPEDEQGKRTIHAWIFTASIATGLGIFVTLLYRVIHSIPNPGGIFFFVIPSVLLAGFLLAREVGVSGSTAKRTATLLRMAMPFLAGVAVPWAIFVIWFIRAGAVKSLLTGLVATSERQILFATHAPLSPLTAGAFAPFLLWVIVAYDTRGLARAFCAAALGIFAALVVWSARVNVEMYGLGWCSLAAAVPILTGAVVVYLWKKRATLNPHRQQQIMLLAFVSALCSIVQFPFSAPGYFFYAAPLTILAASALYQSIPNPPGLALAVLAAFYLLFVLIDVTPYKLGLQRDASAPLRELALPRAGGLRVEEDLATTYEEAVRLIENHARGHFIYATPDSPEIYFLAGLSSPSRHYFEYGEWKGDEVTKIVRKLEDLQVNAIAINRLPEFSRKISQDFEDELKRRFPNAAETDKFTVRWKD
jgi:hypothetical protein